mmetsp:Transcript_26191/g.66553  ORF Transcript_26191/g.66553 Transcript_26191/m.66553 type:complete len:246 (+) Transcript_26191:1277-2014(+)
MRAIWRKTRTRTRTRNERKRRKRKRNNTRPKKPFEKYGRCLQLRIWVCRTQTKKHGTQTGPPVPQRKSSKSIPFPVAMPFATTGQEKDRKNDRMSDRMSDRMGDRKKKGAREETQGAESMCHIPVTILEGKPPSFPSNLGFGETNIRSGGERQVASIPHGVPRSGIIWKQRELWRGGPRHLSPFLLKPLPRCHLSMLLLRFRIAIPPLEARPPPKKGDSPLRRGNNLFKSVWMHSAKAFPGKFSL